MSPETWQVIAGLFTDELVGTAPHGDSSAASTQPAIKPTRRLRQKTVSIVTYEKHETDHQEDRGCQLEDDGQLGLEK